MTNNDRNLGHVPEELREKSLVSAPLGILASLIIPGLGQALAKSLRRGLLLFFSFLTVLALTAWRFALAAPRDTGWGNIIKKGLYLDPFLIFVSIMLILFYLWIAFDTYSLIKDRSKTPLAIFTVLMVLLFSLGWQIGEINPYAFVSHADEALPALGRVAWPWEKAIAYDEEITEAIAEIEIPCSDTPPAINSLSGNEPVLITTPTCGKLRTQDGDSGTVLHLEGYNFVPEREVEILWKDPAGNKFRQRQGGEYITAIPDSDGYFKLEIEMPYRLLPPSATDPTYIWKLFGQQTTLIGGAKISTDFKLIVEKMIETIFMGMMATLFGILLALPVSFLAARNLMSISPITLAIYYLVRLILNIIRSIEPIIWAIIFIIVVGLGPFAGVLALVLHSIAALGKLYSEAIESIDPGPIEAIQATGANWLQTVIYAVIPQIVPPFVSFTIYRWDINVRMSTIIGMVGGGGIGFLLIQYIRLLDYRSAGMCVWFIAITVAILDYVSAEIRARFV